MKIQTPANLVKSIQPEIIELLGPPPVLSTEDAKIYYSVFACFVDDINPNDIVTLMLIKDLADYRWEIARYRRIKAGLVQKAFDDFVSKGQHNITSMYEVCRTSVDARYAAENKALEKELANKPEELKTRQKECRDQNVAKTAAAEKKYKQDLARWEALRSKEGSLALVVDSWIHDVRRIDKLAKSAENRFYDALRAIERHLGGFGETIRERGAKIIDGEIVDRQDEAGATERSEAVRIRKKA